MKLNILLICISLCFFILAGCDVFNHLDRELETEYSEEQVFSSYTSMRDFGLGIYNHLPHGFDRFNGGMLAAATDDAAHTGGDKIIQRLTNGSWGPFDNPDDQWSNYYSGIRKAHKFLENTVDYREVLVRDTVTTEGKQQYDVQTNHIRWLRAEAHFLLAYFYFELTKRYGGVPIVDETLSLDSNLSITRSSFEETVDYIVSQLDAAYEDLRLNWVGFEGDDWIGRATKGATLALKSRVLLYAASPLNNPNNDLDKWIATAEAAHGVIELDEYALAGDYRGLFRSLQNDEIILARRYAADNSLERSIYPVGFEGAVGGTNPTQNLVDAYETINGLPIGEDPGYDPQNPYEDRDPRLQMTVIVNNSDYKGRAVEIWPGGQDGLGAPRATRTGYYLKKFADEGINLSQNTTSVHSWILIRYAEVLLNYAEAMNEVYGPDGTAGGLSLSAREALNMVRSRPDINMPDVAVATQNEFRDRVRNERRIELAFEEHRFWDARRWQLGEEILGSSVYGVEVVRNPDETFTYVYPEESVERRIFREDRMYLYPIPTIEVDKSGGIIEQNPNW